MAATVERTPAEIRATAELDVHLRKKRSDGFELDLSFTVGPGITIVFGASGAGKTTLLDCISGLATPDAGRVAVGKQILFNSASRVSLSVQARRIGYVFQDLALFPHLSVEAN